VPKQAQASHCAGAELLFQWLHDSTYQLYYKFYRDCAGINEPTNVTVCCSNNCNSTTINVILNKVTTLIPPGVNNGNEVARVCPGIHTTCGNPAGTTPGYREWWYANTVTLPSRCNHWTFSVSQSARNSGITNLSNPGSQNLYTEATLDNRDAQGDTSPFFSVKPVPYICANIPYTYNNGAYDLNNDSMVFKIVQPNGGSGCPPTTSAIAFANTTPSLNLTDNPLQTNNTFSINAQNGLMSFTPAGTQIAVVTIQVDEYRNGRKIGSVMRDIQIIVLSCNVQQPEVNISAASLNNATLDNNGNITACAGTPFSFCFDATTPDSNGILLASDNSNIVMPNSVVSYTNQTTDTVTGCFSWWPSVYDTGYKIFTITIMDSSCRPPGLMFSQTFTLPIYVWPATNILSDTTICRGGAANLLAVGGGNFIWSVLPGGSALSTLNCTNCSNPVATPIITTQYVATSQITNAICKNKDTVTVAVIQPFQIILPDTTTCVNNSLQLNAVVNTTNNYTISWTPNTYLSNAGINNPIVTPPSGQSLITYYVKVSSIGSSACSVTDTFKLKVLQGFTIYNHDTTICLGKSVNIAGSGDALYNYTWTPTSGISTILTPSITPNVVTTTTYILTGKYPGCKDSTNKIKITTEPVPTVVAGADRQICSGDTIHLTPLVTPSYPYVYTWTPGSSLDNPNSEFAIFSGLITTHLSLTVKSPVANCSSADSLIINVVKQSFLKVSPQDTSICPSDTVMIKLTTPNDKLVIFNWSPHNFISDYNSVNPYLYPPTSMVYTAWATDTAGCNDTISAYIEIRPGAVIDMPTSIGLYPGDSYQITPQTNCTKFIWFPSSGLNYDSLSNPTVTNLGVNTKYIVIGQTEWGCKVSDSINVMVINDSYIDIPNAFSPTGDHNKTLKVIHLGSATLEYFRIYNRWGNKVFETNDINVGWDGTYNGQAQSQGVYVYEVKAITYKGRVFIKQGNITLMK
jgi:gliding motility-associated-like protein